MKRKLTALALALGLTFTLAACGSGTTGGNAETPAGGNSQSPAPPARPTGGARARAETARYAVLLSSARSASSRRRAYRLYASGSPVARNSRHMVSQSISKPPRP